MVDQDVMKTSSAKEEKIRDVKKDQESRFVKVKRMLTDSLTRKSHAQTPTNYEEAKVICKARKRKERQESTGSVSQERKVIRSNSEERPANVAKDNGKKDIRRVVSHEDFQKAHPLHEHNETIIVSLVEMNRETKCSPPNSMNVDVFGYDDCEHERRRYHERFAPALAQRGRRINPGRKYKNKHFSKSRMHKDENVSKENNNDIKPKIQEDEVISRQDASEKSHEDESKIFNSESNNNFNNFPQIVHQDEKEPSPSPNHTPISSTLDLSTLHQQIDSSEPMPSSSSQEITDQTETLPSLLVASNRMLSSPRNSIMVTHRIYLDPNVQQTKTTLCKESKSLLDKKLKQLSKQISTLKRKVKKYEEEFQMTFGYKPSQADKMNDKNMRKYCTDLSKLKKEYKQLKGDSTTEGFAGETGSPEENKEQKIQNTLTEIEKKLKEQRLTSDRGMVIEDMSSEQIIGEKVAVQKALLYLESVHGRPTTKEDRDLVRPLYDRYRTLKRMMAKISLSNATPNELATIHEHETMDFVSSPPQASETETEKLNPSASTDSDTDISLGESLHTLTLEELLKQQREMNEEKKKLRRSLKEFENEFQEKTGRKLQKEDKLMMANVYTSYKQTKAKLRLLDALVAKQVP